MQPRFDVNGKEEGARGVRSARGRQTSQTGVTDTSFFFSHVEVDSSPLHHNMLT